MGASIASVDRKIVSAMICGVDLTEVYSPARIANACRRFGLHPGSSMDFVTGYDFDLSEDRRRAFAKIHEEEPEIVPRYSPRLPYHKLVM